jgi:tryptophan synthase alpha chain
MNRINKVFKTLRKNLRCGAIAYVTCGDGDTLAHVRDLEAAGATAIELGVPFSDPIADGPVIQAASQRALANGTTIHDVFAIARQVRETSNIPLIAFSYLNPILRYGMPRFAKDAKEAGIDGVLITDLPPESADDTFRRAGLAQTFLLAPTSTNARIKAVNRASDGFVYYVSTTGVTGMRNELDPALLERLREVRLKLRHPIAVGFGISKREHYEALRRDCDAIVVGSAIVRAIGEGRSPGDVLRAILPHPATA